MTVVPATRAPRTGAQTADLVVTIVLLVALGVLAWVLSFLGLFISMASDGCMGGPCDTGLITVGVIIGTVGPWLIALAAAAWAIIRLVRRRTAWWLPLVAAPVMIGMLSAASAIAMAGVD